MNRLSARARVGFPTCAALAALIASAAPASAATGDPTVDCMPGVAETTVTKFYPSPSHPNGVPLRCGTSKKGYQHLKKHGWNATMDECIRRTIVEETWQAPSAASYGRFVREFVAGGRILEFRVLVDMTQRDNLQYGIITAYNNSRDEGVDIPDYACTSR